LEARRPGAPAHRAVGSDINRVSLETMSTGLSIQMSRSGVFGSAPLGRATTYCVSPIVFEPFLRSSRVALHEFNGCPRDPRDGAQRNSGLPHSKVRRALLAILNDPQAHDGKRISFLQ